MAEDHSIRDSSMFMEKDKISQIFVQAKIN